MTLRFFKEHTWVDATNPDAAVVGITAYAQDVLGDVVYADLPAVGTSLRQGAVAGVVESVKTAADMHAPVSGEVVAVNEALRADPSLLNTAPLAAGWCFKVRLTVPSELSSLMDEAAYARHTGGTAGQD